MFCDVSTTKKCCEKWWCKGGADHKNFCSIYGRMQQYNGCYMCQYKNMNIIFNMIKVDVLVIH